MKLFRIPDQPIQGETLDFAPEDIADPRIVHPDFLGDVLQAGTLQLEGIDL